MKLLATMSLLGLCLLLSATFPQASAMDLSWGRLRNKVRQTSIRIKNAIRYRSRSPSLQSADSKTTDHSDRSPVNIKVADIEPYSVSSLPQIHQQLSHSATSLIAAQKHPPEGLMAINPNLPRHDKSSLSITTKEKVNQELDSPLVSPVSTLSSAFSLVSSSRNELYDKIMEQKRSSHSSSDSSRFSLLSQDQPEALTSWISQPSGSTAERSWLTPAPKMRYIIKDNTPYDEDDFY